MTGVSATSSTSSSTPSPPAWIPFALIPGVILTAVLAVLSMEFSEWFGEEVLGFENSPVSGVMIAIILGIIIANTIQLPATLKPGITFSMKRILKLGIILLGIRLSLGDIVEVGAVGLPIIIFCLSGALLIATWFSKRLSLSTRLGALIAVGTSICGATAIVATGPTVDANEEELTYAVANITIFGIVAMFLYPFIANTLFAESALAAGLFLGTSIHETAQVAGGGLIHSQLFGDEEVLNVATTTKLVRNMFMLMVIPLIAYQFRNQTQGAVQEKVNLRKLFPTFILGFLFVALIRTVGDATESASGEAFWMLSSAQWDNVVETLKDMAELLLVTAMAGVGLGTSIRQLRHLGIKPFYVGFTAAISVAGLSIAALLFFQTVGAI